MAAWARDRRARRRACDRDSRTDRPLAAGARLRRRRLRVRRCSRTSATGSTSATTAPRSSVSTSAGGPASTSIHAGGCLLFALAFGPALTRSVQRFARRLQVSWHPAEEPRRPGRCGADHRAAVLAVLLVDRRYPGMDRRPRRSAAPRPRTCSAPRTRDGGFGAAPGGSVVALYCGLGRARTRGGRATTRSTSAAAARACSTTSARAPRRATIGALERTILVARAAGLSATSFGGQDLVAALRRRDPARRVVSDQVNLTAFAVLALRAAGASLPASRTMSWLRHQQNARRRLQLRDAPAEAATSTTPAQRSRRSAAPARVRPARRRSSARQQNRDGGFPSQPGRRVERPVDRVGRAGPARGGRRSRLAAPRAVRVSPLAVPALADRRRRTRPLRAQRRPDARLGDRAGADGARAQAAAAGARGARERRPTQRSRVAPAGTPRAKRRLGAPGGSQRGGPGAPTHLRQGQHAAAPGTAGPTAAARRLSAGRCSAMPPRRG